MPAASSMEGREEEMRVLKNPFCNLKHLSGKKRPVTVAFFGGSITWGGNAGCWREIVGKWFSKQFPDIWLINGGYGGTGSDVGAFRVDEHILSHKPDLVFTEFSINDAGAFQSTVMAAHEAIIRKIWRRNPRTGIILVISGSCDDRQCELVTKRVGEDFGLHVIDVGSEKSRLVQRGRYANSDLFADVVHPSETGHTVYAGVVKKHLGRLLAEAASNPVRHSLPRKFKYRRTWEYADARLVPAKNCPRAGRGWKLIEDHYKRFDGVCPAEAEWPDRSGWPFPYRKGLMTTSTPGDSIRYTGRIRRAGLALDFTQGSCRYEVQADGKSMGTFEHNQGAGRFPRVPVFNMLLDGKTHTLQVVLKEGRINLGYFQIS